MRIRTLISGRNFRFRRSHTPSGPFRAPRNRRFSTISVNPFFRVSAAGGHQRQFDGARVGHHGRPVPLQGGHARIRRSERRGHGLHEGRTGHRQPPGSVRAAQRHGPHRVFRVVRARAREDHVDVPRHGNRHGTRSKILFGE